MKTTKIASLVAAITSLGLAAPMAAMANSTPNPYTPVGTSWVTADESEKVYFEDFGEGTQDDTNIFYIPAGVTCTINGVTANGPFLAGDNNEPNDSDCNQGGVAYDPVDYSGSNRIGAHPIGFEVNFFGTTYSDLYFSENGIVFFDAPDTDYDDNLTELAVNAESSLIAPLAVDLFYDENEGSFWTAQTTVDGKQAFVISWQNMDECCDSATPDDNSASFQFVFLNYGDGNFVAYFNYDEFDNIDEGYDPVSWVDMKNGVTVGSNIAKVDTVAGLRAGVCEQIDHAFTAGSGSLDDSAWETNAAYMKVEDAETKTISVWQDNACTTPNNIATLQDISSGPVYVGLEPSNMTGFNAVAIGWATYDPATGATDTTELFANIDLSTLYDGGSSELIDYSLNTDVPGRIVIGMSGGRTVVENPTTLGGAPAVYTGPIVLALSELEVSSSGASRVSITGLQFDQVTAASVDGKSLTILEKEREKLVVSIPSLTAGIKDLVLTWGGGAVLTHRNSFSVVEATAPADTKVNAGSFKGYVAIYARGYEGQRLSAKVGNDWVVVPSIVNNQANGTLFRAVEFTGAGYTINVRIFIDRVLVDTITVTTK